MKAFRSIVLTALLGALAPAFAQYFPPPPLGVDPHTLMVGRFTSLMLMRSRAQLEGAQAAANAGNRAASGGDEREAQTTPAASTRLKATPSPQIRKQSIAKIAAAYPEKSRPEVERVFGELLAGYAKIEQQFSIPKYDVAGAVAASYPALTRLTTAPRFRMKISRHWSRRCARSSPATRSGLP